MRPILSLNFFLKRMRLVPTLVWFVKHKQQKNQILIISVISFFNDRHIVLNCRIKLFSKLGPNLDSCAILQNELKSSRGKFNRKDSVLNLDQNTLEDQNAQLSTRICIWSYTFRHQIHDNLGQAQKTEPKHEY